jgi:hypothetical protein
MPPKKQEVHIHRSQEQIKRPHDPKPPLQFVHFVISFLELPSDESFIHFSRNIGEFAQILETDALLLLRVLQAEPPRRASVRPRRAPPTRGG